MGSRMLAGALSLALVSCGSKITDAPRDAGKAVAVVDATVEPEPEQDAGPPPIEDACTPLPWYPDVDGDGFGDATAQPTMACEQPAGFVADHTDCADADARANPSQTVMQESPVKGIGGADFNCDGIESPKLMEATRTCVPGCSFAAGPGWLNMAPECGETGTWLLDCGGGPAVCTMQTEARGRLCL